MTGADAEFMFALLNDQSWLRFIGDRGVRTVEDAEHYIRSGPVKMYEELGYGFCIVESKETLRPLGICGLAKRNTWQIQILALRYFLNTGVAVTHLKPRLPCSNMRNRNWDLRGFWQRPG